MYLTDEQRRYDDTRWYNCNLETELNYGGVTIKDRKSITNEDIRFYAWICRAALKRIKSKHTGKWFGSVCSRCGVSVSGWYDYLYCPFCGSRNEWDEEEIKNKKIKSSGKKLAKAISENAQKLCDKYNELREEDNKELFEKVKMLKAQVRKKRKEHKKIICPKPIEKCSNFINCSVKMDESEDEK